MDGRYALPHKNQGTCEHRNGLACPGLQHEADDQYIGRGGIDEGDEHIGAFSVENTLEARLLINPQTS